MKTNWTIEEVREMKEEVSAMRDELKVIDLNAIMVLDLAEARDALSKALTILSR